MLNVTTGRTGNSLCLLAVLGVQSPGAEIRESMETAAFHGQVHMAPQETLTLYQLN